MVYRSRPTEKGVSRDSAPGPMTNKQVESCFLNQSSSIHFCCTDSLLMTHLGGLSLSISIWRRGVASFILPWGPKIIFLALNRSIIHKLNIQPVKYMINSNKVTKGRIIRIPKKKSKRYHVLYNGSASLCMKHIIGQNMEHSQFYGTISIYRSTLGRICFIFQKVNFNLGNSNFRKKSYKLLIL
jgi:hypothetical protein